MIGGSRRQLKERSLRARRAELTRWEGVGSLRLFLRREAGGNETSAGKMQHVRMVIGSRQKENARVGGKLGVHAPARLQS